MAVADGVDVHALGLWVGAVGLVCVAPAVPVCGCRRSHRRPEPPLRLPCWRSHSRPRPARTRPGSGVSGGLPARFLFRRPAGLADGLALKEPAPSAGSPRNSPQGTGSPAPRMSWRPRIRRDGNIHVVAAAASRSSPHGGAACLVVRDTGRTSCVPRKVRRSAPAGATVRPDAIDRADRATRRLPGARRVRRRDHADSRQDHQRPAEPRVGQRGTRLPGARDQEHHPGLRRGLGGQRRRRGAGGVSRPRLPAPTRPR